MKKLFTLILLASGIASNAQRLFTEDFNYATGQLTNYVTGGTNVSGGIWTGFSGTANPINIASGSLSYPNYFTAPGGGSNKLTTICIATSAEDAYRQFTTPVTTGTVYVSTIMRVTDVTTLPINTDANGDYLFAFLPSSSTTAFVGRVVFRKGVAANTFNIGIRSSGSVAPVFGATDYALNTNYLIVMAYQIVSGAANDVTKLWVNPAFSATESTPLLSSDFVGGGTESADIARVVVRQGSGTPGVELDAMIASTSWSDASLPVKLTSFNAALVGGKASIKWTVANELNMEGYAIEKSNNGTNYNQIGFVQATNNNSYSFSDASIASGLNYYRLKILDKDAKTSYSNVAIINTKNSVGSISVYPNPTLNILGVTHEKATANAIARIASLDGKTIASYPLQIGATTSSIDVSKLTKGNYIVSIENGNERQVAKFVKQ
jgi:Secretion system C-terminal sorting domain